METKGPNFDSALHTLFGRSKEPSDDEKACFGSLLELIKQQMQQQTPLKASKVGAQYKKVEENEYSFLAKYPISVSYSLS